MRQPLKWDATVWGKDDHWAALCIFSFSHQPSSLLIKTCACKMACFTLDVRCMQWTWWFVDALCLLLKGAFVFYASTLHAWADVFRRMHEMFEPQQQHLGRYNGIKCKWSTALATRTMSACPNTQQQQQQQQQLSVVQPALVKQQQQHQQWQQLKKKTENWKVSCFKWHQSRVQIRSLFCVMTQSWHHHHLAESIIVIIIFICTFAQTSAVKCEECACFSFFVSYISSVAGRAVTMKHKHWLNNKHAE